VIPIIITNKISVSKRDLFKLDFMCYKNINYEFRNRQIHELEINNNKNKEYVSMN